MRIWTDVRAGMNAGFHLLPGREKLEDAGKSVLGVADEYQRLPCVPGVQRTETLQIAKLVKYGYDWGHGPGAPAQGPQ